MLINPEGKLLAVLNASGYVTARRQATVRPGDPLYRPQIRFLVRPNGLRTYYLAYPLLESLQVPLSLGIFPQRQVRLADRQPDGRLRQRLVRELAVQCLGRPVQ